MEKINLKIEKHEDKTAANGKDYSRFQTDRGWFSAFEADVIKSLKENEGKVCTVDIAVTKSKDGDREFHNIRKFHGVSDEDVDIIPIKASAMKSSEYNPTSMYVSYAKDLCQVLIEEKVWDTSKKCMEDAIERIKQAEKEFS